MAGWDGSWRRRRRGSARPGAARRGRHPTVGFGGGAFARAPVGWRSNFSWDWLYGTWRLASRASPRRRRARGSRTGHAELLLRLPLRLRRIRPSGGRDVPWWPRPGPEGGGAPPPRSRLGSRRPDVVRRRGAAGLDRPPSGPRGFRLLFTGAGARRAALRTSPSSTTQRCGRPARLPGPRRGRGRRGDDAGYGIVTTASGRDAARLPERGDFPEYPGDGRRRCRLPAGGLASTSDVRGTLGPPSRPCSRSVPPPAPTDGPRSRRRGCWRGVGPGLPLKANVRQPVHRSTS